MPKNENVKAKTPAPKPAATVVKLGLDLGTNTTVVAAKCGEQLIDFPNETDLIRSVIGFPKAGIIPGILPNDTDTLFGDEAVDYRLHLDLKWILHEGCVDDVETTRLFTKHLRNVVTNDPKQQVWGVVGAPANCTKEQQKSLRATMVGVLDRLVVVPEPFLAAMGLRDDPHYGKTGGDPTKHSLIVDIGAGTTDLCLVRGYYPTADDQISFPQAGNFIDDTLAQCIARRYPDLKLTRVTITQLKESHSFVEGFDRDANVKVYVDGRPRIVDFAEIIQEACDALVPLILRGIRDLLSRCDSDSIVKVMENIIVTGGGSQISGLCERLQETLREEGYDCARTVRPSDYKRLVANGALKVADNVRDDQWQVPM